MVRHALLSQFRSSLPRFTTKLHLRSFYAYVLEPSIGELLVRKAKFLNEKENTDDDDDDDAIQFTQIDRAVGQTLSLVATQAITPQTAVQRITSLAKNQTEHTLYQICATLWECSVSASRKSEDSTVLIANFLVHLSDQSQENFEDQPKDSIHSPIMVPGDWGNKERLWYDMPGMWGLLNRMSDTPPCLRPNYDFQDVYFLSLLFRSRRCVFKGLDSYLADTFPSAAYWPLHPEKYESWRFAIQAILTLLNTAGALLKERVLENHPNERSVNVGQWRRWQRLLFKIAADESLGLEFRGLAKQAADMMTIEKHLTNHWWRRWRRELLEITADPGQESYDRVMAKQINEILAGENEEQESAAVRLLPMPPPSPLLLLPPRSLALLPTSILTSTGPCLISTFISRVVSSSHGHAAVSSGDKR